jgi:hypothetical protein
MLWRGKGLAVVKRQAPVIEVPVIGTTPPPRSKEGTHPGRVSRMRNTVTPTRSGLVCEVGRLTARKAELLWREQDVQEANAGRRKSTGNRDLVVAAPPSSRFPDNWPDIEARCSDLERGADVDR